MNDSVDFIFEKWHEYAKEQKIEELADLYAEEAIFESPLISVILGSESGVLHGKKNIKNFFVKATALRSDNPINWFRSGEYYTDGHTLVWEYPRETPDGEQFDVLEVMELHAGKILKHRVYMGWLSCKNLFSTTTA